MTSWCQFWFSGAFLVRTGANGASQPGFGLSGADAILAQVHQKVHTFEKRVNLSEIKLFHWSFFIRQLLLQICNWIMNRVHFFEKLLLFSFFPKHESRRVLDKAELISKSHYLCANIMNDETSSIRDFLDWLPLHGIHFQVLRVKIHGFTFYLRIASFCANSLFVIRSCDNLRGDRR